ncbi:Transcription factor bHLH25 [Dichanthelium oligosanthes]|uniref:Transcription factor bHLH25 n=1 Tax=Dichanthelium oligosanthes TaxID=888268 RepID=A0A1E5V743_9POAL|nr:Transcription factor bHLH25 [Dichanthelium oligosanthes]
MEDYSGLFMQWAMDTLQQEHLAAAPVDDGSAEEATFPSLQALREASQAEEMVQELIGQPHAANSWSSGDGDTADGSSVGNNADPALSRSGISTTRPASWNFGAASAPPGRDVLSGVATARSLPELVYGSPPTRRAALLKSVGSMYAQDHIIAERKRREKINQRFIELSTVIPGLKKMDKATILSDATRYVKELQEKIKALEDGSNDRSIESWVLVKKPCIVVPDEDSSPSWTSSGTPATLRKPLPEIEARFLEKRVMVRIHCEDGKGVAMRVLTEVEELHLSIIHANVMPFLATTLIITITAKASSFHFTFT